MTCAEAQELMLECDEAALAGVGPSPLAEHLRSCAACTAAAKRILGDTASMRDAYFALAPQIGPERIRGRIAARRVAWRVAAFAAAAAVILTVIARRDTPGNKEQTPLAARDSTTASIAVEVPEGRNAIVFATKNPLVDVVWIY